MTSAWQSEISELLRLTEENLSSRPTSWSSSPSASHQYQWQGASDSYPPRSSATARHSSVASKAIDDHFHDIEELKVLQMSLRSDAQNLEERIGRGMRDLQREMQSWRGELEQSFAAEIGRNNAKLVRQQSEFTHEIQERMDADSVERKLYAEAKVRLQGELSTLQAAMSNVMGDYQQSFGMQQQWQAGIEQTVLGLRQQVESVLNGVANQLSSAKNASNGILEQKLQEKEVEIAAMQQQMGEMKAQQQQMQQQFTSLLSELRVRGQSDASAQEMSAALLDQRISTLERGQASLVASSASALMQREKVATQPDLQALQPLLTQLHQQRASIEEVRSSVKQLQIEGQRLQEVPPVPLSRGENAANIDIPGLQAGMETLRADIASLQQQTSLWATQAELQEASLKFSEVGKVLEGQEAKLSETSRHLWASDDVWRELEGRLSRCEEDLSQLRETQGHLSQTLAAAAAIPSLPTIPLDMEKKEEEDTIDSPRSSPNISAQLPPPNPLEVTAKQLNLSESDHEPEPEPEPEIEPKNENETENNVDVAVHPSGSETAKVADEWAEPTAVDDSRPAQEAGPLSLSPAEGREEEEEDEEDLMAQQLAEAANMEALRLKQLAEAEQLRLERERRNLRVVAASARSSASVSRVESKDSIADGDGESSINAAESSPAVGQQFSPMDHSGATTSSTTSSSDDEDEDAGSSFQWKKSVIENISKLEVTALSDAGDETSGSEMSPLEKEKTSSALTSFELTPLKREERD
jgi:hypothetical protein